MRTQYEKKDEKKKIEESTIVKLPKLVISKFGGTALAWFRFWIPFETKDHKQDRIRPATKHSYLKEFLNPTSSLLYLRATPVRNNFF